MPDRPGVDARTKIVLQLTARLGALAAAGPVQRNYFSSLFTADLASGARLMVKVPQTDLRERPREAPLTAEDRQLGRAEFDSLSRLSGTWNGDDLRVRWIRPVAFFEDVNAIVTERVDAGEVLAPYRRQALWQLAGSDAAGAHLIDVMARIGGALGRFHRRFAAPMIVDGAALAARVRGYADRLEALRGADDVLARARALADRVAGQRWPSVETSTLKGLDIRNVLEAGDGSIWLLDPGKTKRTAREADLARFLITWRILFWGSVWFAARLAPHPSTDRAFLDAYWAGEDGHDGALAAYELKELLKHWHTALDSLERQGWGAWRRALVRRRYIEPFYRARLAATMDRLA